MVRFDDWKDDNREAYQAPCLAAIKKARTEGVGKALVVMAGGLGKTIVSARDVRDFLEASGGRVLFLCHDTGILDQNRKKYERVLGEDYTCGVFYGAEKDFHEVDVLFASFQTMESKNRWKELFFPDEFAYIVVDEAHHAKARTYERALRYFKPKFLLGLTATPEREDGQPLSGVFGEPVFNMGFVEAWTAGFLAGVEYEVLTDEMSGLKYFLDTENNERISIRELNRRIITPKRDEWLVADIAERSRVKSDPRTIVFCQSIHHAVHISGLIKGSVLLHSDTPKHRLSREEQAKNLQAFRDGTAKTIVVVDKFNEGIDVPEVDVLVRLRLTGSKTVFEQQLFRGLRLSEGKDSVLVLDYVTSCEQLEQLYALDERIAQIRERRAGERGPGVEPKFVLNIRSAGFKAEKVDILRLIKQAREYSGRFACGRGYTRDELIGQLREKAKILGRTPYYREVAADASMAHPETFGNMFGSYAAACKAAGLKPHMYSGYTEEEVIAQYNRKYEALGGKTPTINEISDDKDMVSAKVVKRLFGSHTALCELLGFASNVGAPAKETLAAQLIDWSARNYNKVPTSVDINNDDSMASYSTFLRVFGSRAAMYEAAGMPPPKRRPPGSPFPSVESLAAQFTAKAESMGGKTPTKQDIIDDPCMASWDSFREAFGSHFTLCAATGFKPNRGKRPKK